MFWTGTGSTGAGPRTTYGVYGHTRLPHQADTLTQLDARLDTTSKPHRTPKIPPLPEPASEGEPADDTPDPTSPDDRN